MSTKQPICFGRYLLLDRVNVGGMAEVWRAKTFGAEGFEKIVAIKRILPNIAEDEEFIRMFIDEAKISASLTHANISRIEELGKIAESYFIAMEYVSGRDLRAVFDRGRKTGDPAPIPMTCYIMTKVCEGLDYAHRKKDPAGRDLNIVHRDVSPANVLISYEGEIKVIDFGIAKAANKATRTQAGILKGKFGYMSPEQVRGLPLDRRSDVFALGIILYEMLAGERLFVGQTDFSVLEKVRQVDILPPSTYNRRIAGPLEKIVYKALTKDVEDRYPYASDLAEDLQKFLLSGDTVYGRKDLMQYMKSTFAEDFEHEKMRLGEYAEVKLPSPLAPGAGAPDAPALPPSFLPTPAGGAPRAPTRVDDRGDGPRGPPVVAPHAGPTSAHRPNELGASRAPRKTGEQPGSGPARASAGASEDARTLPPTGGPARRGTGQPPQASPDELAQTLPPMNRDELMVVRHDVITSPGGPPMPSPAPPSPRGDEAANTYPRAKAPADLTAEDDDDLPPTEVRSSVKEMREALFGPARRSWLVPAVAGGLAGLALLAAVGFFLWRTPTARVFVIVEPREARAFVDGREVRTRSELLLTPGQHLIEVRLDGYQPHRGVVNAAADGSAIAEVTLERIVRTGMLIVVPLPADARVEVDGREYGAGGKSDGVAVEVTVGAEHAVAVRRAGYKPQAIAASVGPGGTTVKRVELAPLAIRVASSPPGADLFIDGQRHGDKTPTYLRGVDPAKDHQLEFVKRCYEPFAVVLKAGDTEVPAAQLERVPGCR